jgi:beta-barrel assembly-enhancing protease
MTAPLSTHRFTRLRRFAATARQARVLAVSARQARIIATLAVAAALTADGATQTRITAPSNKYSPADDVKLGREAAAEAKKELPMLNDERVDDWVEDVGARLAASIPPEFQHKEFQYTFDVVNQSEINAFALPGGPMFLNRGMIEKAKTEGEVAGVMAHELSHVALRHGTAQATKGEKFQIGAIAGQVLGAIVGGTAGSIISQGSQFGLGTYFLKYSREYESQADILGAQMLARAGYDPREMANMFKTIEAEGGGSGPEWMSSHPNPGNRFARINEEAKALRVNGGYNTGQFAAVQSRLRGAGRSYTAEEIAQGKARSTPTATAGRVNTRIDPPASAMRTYRPTNFLQVSVPSNWAQVNQNAGITYAPQGAFYDTQGGTAFTHGVQFGVAQGGSGNLQRDTQSLLNSFAKSNPDLRQTSGYSRVNINGRQGLVTQLSNRSDVTGEPEFVQFTTTYLRDGSVLYMIGVAPTAEANTYNNTFNRVRSSLQLADR